jgi:hypothetical protein
VKSGLDTGETDEQDCFAPLRPPRWLGSLSTFIGEIYTNKFGDFSNLLTFTSTRIYLPLVYFHLLWVWGWEWIWCNRSFHPNPHIFSHFSIPSGYFYFGDGRGFRFDDKKKNFAPTTLIL